MRKRSTCQNGNGCGHNPAGEMSEGGRDELEDQSWEGVLGNRMEVGLKERAGMRGRCGGKQ
eukprot:12887073-Prorocentrum_lima.AAC.1